MSYVAEKVSGTKYISVPRALEESELSKEELERAMALGFVSVIEVGTTRFIERSSLDGYVEVQMGKEPTVSPFINPLDVPRKSDSTFENNEMFTEALSRDLSLEKRRPLVPAVIAVALTLAALLLALPLPKDMDSSRAAAVDAVAPEEIRVMVKEALSKVFNSIVNPGK